MRHPTTVQVARAANIVYAMLQFRRLMDREDLAPVSHQVSVKLEWDLCLYILCIKIRVLNMRVKEH